MFSALYVLSSVCPPLCVFSVFSALCSPLCVFSALCVLSSATSEAVRNGPRVTVGYAWSSHVRESVGGGEVGEGRRVGWERGGKVE